MMQRLFYRTLTHLSYTGRKQMFADLMPESKTHDEQVERLLIQL